MRYTEHELEEILKEETEISDEVNNKIQYAYQCILKNNSLKRIAPIPQKWQKRYTKIAAAFAIILLTGTTAFAAIHYEGLAEYFNGNHFSGNNTKISKEAEELIQKPINEPENETSDDENGYANPKTVTSDFFTTTIQEALCDSQKIYLTVAVKAKEADKYLMLMQDAMLEEPISDFGISYDESDISIKEYAEKTGKQLLIASPSIWQNGVYVTNGYDIKIYPDGTSIFTITADNESHAKKLNLTCDVSVRSFDNNAIAKEEKTSFPFQLNNKTNEKHLVYIPANNGNIADGCATIKRIEIRTSELGTYANIEYTPGKQKYVFFHILGKDGKELSNSFAGEGGGIYDLENGNKHTELYYEPTQLQDTITIQASVDDEWDEKIIDTFKATLQK